MKELLQKIILKVYEITINTKHDAFVKYWGHVNSIEVSIIRDGWKPNKDNSFSKDICLDRENAKEELEIVLKILEEYYREGVEENE